MKLIMRNILIFLGLLPLTVFADNMPDEKRPQTSEEQAWEPIDKWVDDGEKESLESDYVEEFEKEGHLTAPAQSGVQGAVTQHKKPATHHKKTAHKKVTHALTMPIPMSSVLQHTPILPSIYYAPQFNLGGFYGSNGGSYGEADIWTPIWQAWDRILYVDIRGQKDNASSWDGAAGLGYRWLSDDGERLYDVHSYYNYYNSTYNKVYQQAVLGGRFRTENWSVRGDYYYSIGQTEYTEHSLDTLDLIHTQGIQYEGLISFGSENNFINGGTIELGRTIPYAPGLSLYAGYYGFAKDLSHPFISGVKARAEYVLDEAFDFKAPFMRHITLESVYQYDNVNLGAFTVGARIDVPLGKSHTSSRLQEYMLDYVRFYPHAIQEHIEATPPTLYTQNGTTVIFDKVETASDLHTALTDNSTVVIIKNNFQLAAPETIGNGKYITGQNYEYMPGLFMNISGNTTLPTLTAALNSNLFVLGQNDTLIDLNLMIKQTATGVDKIDNIYILTNNNNNSIGSLNVDNLTANGGVYINVGDATNSSNISITNSTLNSINLQTSTISSGMTIANIEGNKVNASMTFDNIGIQNIANVNSNTVGNITFNNIGGGTQTISNVNSNILQTGRISFYNNKGTQNISSVNNNTLSSSLGLILFFNGSSSGVATQNISNVNNNILNLAAINFNNENNGTQNIVNVSGNQMTFGDSVQNMNAIYFNNNSTNAQTITNVTDNQITFGNGASNVNGIYFNNSNTGVQNIVNTNANNIAFGNYAYATNAIYFSNKNLNLIFNSSIIQNITNVNNNQITFGDYAGVGGGDTTYGIFFQNVADQNMTAQSIVSVIGNIINFGNYAGAGVIQAIGGDTIGVVGILFDVEEGSKPIVHTIGTVNNNTITFKNYAGTILNGLVGQVSGIYFHNTSAKWDTGYTTQNIGLIQNNQITFGDYAGASSYDGFWAGTTGILLVNKNTQGYKPLYQNVEKMNNNSISYGLNAGSSNGRATGVLFFNGYDNSGTTQTLNNVSDNIIRFGNAMGYSRGISFINNGIITVNGMTSNTVTGAPSKNGIYIVNNGTTFNLYILGNPSGMPVVGIPAQEAALAQNNNGASVDIASGTIHMTDSRL
jgi:hypothetical protein